MVKSGKPFDEGISEIKNINPDIVLIGEQHAGDVVDAAATAAGCELLAVINLTQQDAELALESNRGTRLQKLPLPYSL